MLKRIIKTFVTMAITALLFGITAFANVPTENTLITIKENPTTGWSELEPSQYPTTNNSVLRYEPEWVLKSTKKFSFRAGDITMKSYTMTLLNDTKLAKATTSHSLGFHGYVRARFETLNGTIQDGSDSGRIYSYYGSTAETPYSKDNTGWVGVAHTYCGVD